MTSEDNPWTIPNIRPIILSSITDLSGYQIDLYKVQIGYSLAGQAYLSPPLIDEMIINLLSCNLYFM